MLYALCINDRGDRGRCQSGYYEKKGQLNQQNCQGRGRDCGRDGQSNHSNVSATIVTSMNTTQKNANQTWSVIVTASMNTMQRSVISRKR